MKPLLNVLMILDALEKESSSATASIKLYKTPSTLSYITHKLENDLDTRLFNRSGHRAKPIRTGKMSLEKGREVLHTMRELEEQAAKLHEGWENEPMINVGDTFPSSLLAPLVEAFYQHYSVTCLKFINGVLNGSQDALTQGRTDTIVGTMYKPSFSNELDFSWLGNLEQVLAVAPHHPLALEEEPLNHRIIKQYRVIVVRDTTQAGAPTASQLLDEQETITVFDSKTKLEPQVSGLGCGCLPRYLVQRLLDSGALVEEKVIARTLLEPVWIGWDKQITGLASDWRRDEALADSVIAGVYAKSDGRKSTT